MCEVKLDLNPRLPYIPSMLNHPAPFYQSHVFCCTNVRDEKKRRSCGMHNSERLRAYMKERVKMAGIAGTRINTAGCLDRCELGPVLVIYPEGVWYHYSDAADIDEIVEVHLKQGGRVERLLLPPDR
jgi:(2Fe-2S) ferredoxin